MGNFDFQYLEESKFSIKFDDDNELLQFKEFYNYVIDDLIILNNKLKDVQNEFIFVNKKLDD